MTPVALGLAWAAVIVATAYRRRPAPRRIRALPGQSGHTRPAARPQSAHLPWLARLPDRAGAWMLRRLGRPVDPVTAHRLGGAILAGAAVLPLVPIGAPAAALVAWALPGVRRGRAERSRLAALAGDLPDVVDLLVLAVGAGLTVHLAVASVARRGTGPLAAELARANREVTLGRRLADALDDLPSRAGEAVRPLVGALVASDRYGASLSVGLERLADEVRRDRRRRAEEAARKVPVKLLFPLVTCTLPAFGLLTVAPLIASAIRSLTF
jgi:tight adherence protein C